MCSTIKIPKSIIADASLSKSAKLKLLFFIAECDQAGIWTIDKAKFKKVLGLKFSRRNIQNTLRDFVEFIDNDRLLIIPFLQWTWGKRLDSFYNEKAYYFTKTREVILRHGMKFFVVEKRVAPFS